MRVVDAYVITQINGHGIYLIELQFWS
ncbi:MAG: Unknown protein, partial [uncultured Thiotrichaceae bacterium]